MAPSPGFIWRHQFKQCGTDGVLGNKTIYTDVKGAWKELHPGMNAKGATPQRTFGITAHGATSKFEP
jgi:hypothetical protein